MTCTCEPIVLGHFRMDGGGLFGVIPRKLWQRIMPPDEENRVRLVTLAMLVRGPDFIMVIDAGLGDKLDEKQRKIFAIDQPENSLRTELSSRGISPGDVTHFVYTHLHFDHAGGATEVRDGVVQPLFPNAAHYVSKAQLDWASAPSPKDKASFQPHNWKPVQDTGLLNVLESGNSQIVPGVELLEFHGHTPGMLCPLVHTQAGPMFYAVDLFPTPGHFPVHYVAAFDNQPMTTMEEKSRIQERARTEQWNMIFGHASPDTGHPTP